MTTVVPELSPELEALRAEARTFADTVVRPGADERDRTKVLPLDIVARIAQKGWLALLVPPEYGGSGAGNFRQCLILEEIARADAATHVTVSVHNSLITGPLVKHGTAALKKRYLPDLARGALIGGYALTEPGAGSDAAALACTAVRDGDDWVLNGSKMWITTGNTAGLFVLFARTDRTVSKAKGISAFIVPRHAPGFTAGKPENKLGIRASETVQLFLENVRVPADHLLGEVNRGFNYAMETLNGGRVGIATQAVGIGQAILDTLCDFLRNRRRAGAPVTVGQHEEFRVAEIATDVEAARLLTWRAARLRDDGVDHVREASMAKLFASTMANRAARAAKAIVGTASAPEVATLDRLFRDARITEIYEGTTEVQKLVIGRQVIRS